MKRQISLPSKFFSVFALSLLANTASADPVNNVDCATDLAQGVIGGSVAMSLSGTEVIDWTVIYNGTTYDNLPSGNFNLPNIVGDVDSITIRANGVDGMMNPIFDQEVCDIDYIPPSCGTASQNPDTSVTPVDPGTVVSLELDTTGAVSAEIDMVSMTPDVDPDSNNGVTWSASSTVLNDVTLDALITNPDGETTACSWTLDVNCVDPTLVEPLPSAGNTGITLTGTEFCRYDARIATPNSCNVISISAGIGGNGTDNSFVMPSGPVVVEVGQVGSLPDDSCPVVANPQPVPVADRSVLWLLALSLGSIGLLGLRRRMRKNS